MSTVVLQSYRTTDVAPWIARSLDTVRGWAASQGFSYAFLDDAFFDILPAWFRARAGGDRVIMSDLARLLHARRLLGEHERVVWVDADVTVFDPEAFRVEAPEGYALCREIWLSPAPGGRFTVSPRVNNMVMVLARANPFLDFYIHACERVARGVAAPLGKLDLGTKMLSMFHLGMPLPLLGSVALLSPLVLADVARGGGEISRIYMDRLGTAVHAANLCASLSGQIFDGVAVSEALFDAAVERLLASRGEALNRFLRR
jgi:hypothetical protein